MKKANKSILAAAIAGLLVGTTTSCKGNADMQDQNTPVQKSGCNGKSGCAEKGKCSGEKK